MLQEVAPPPPPPPPPVPQVPQVPQVSVTGLEPTVAGTPSPADYLQALRESRSELRNQLERLTETRDELRQDILESREQGLSITGLEARMTGVDQRIQAIEQQLALADAQVAQAAAVPGAVQPEPQYVRQGPPEEFFVLSGFFIVFVMFPLSIALARRLWKRTTTAVAAIPSDVGDRLRAIEQAVEAVAMEVERIGEGQRFMSRIFTERGGEPRALGEGAAQPIDVAQRQPVSERR